jgi:mono/diheme cytochrome c family protein
MLGTALLIAAPVLAQDDEPVKRGEYLVTIGLCNDCHTPLTMGPSGPEPDMSRMLSGHPQDLAIAAPTTVAEPWMGAMSSTLTAWSGPWGVSFTANLTPDTATGLGSWTEEMFIKALRTGKHQGEGRPILPPMPWPMISQMSDEDLKAVFAYLRTLPPITNAVPEPLPPPEAAR